jgi:hypothetical protein
VIRDQFCDIDVSVFITDFSNFEDNENRNAEVNKIPYDVEVHDC